MRCECYICHKWGDTHRHHVFYGRSNRKNSEKYGYVINVCPECHSDLHDRNPQKYEYLKRDFQRIHEQTYSREHFIQTFGKSYL